MMQMKGELEKAFGSFRDTPKKNAKREKV